MPASLRLTAIAVLAAATALPAAAQDRPARPERADTVEFKLGRRIQIVRAPGSERQQRIRISRDRDTTDVTLDINPEMAERWMRRILILDDDTTETRADDDSLGVPVRVRMRTRRAPGAHDDAERYSEERTVELRTADGQTQRFVLRDGEPLPDAVRDLAPEAIREIEIVRRDTDGTVRPGRPSGLWVERAGAGQRPGGEVVVLRDGDLPGAGVRIFRNGSAMEENVRVIRDGDVLRIERDGQPSRTVRLNRTPQQRPDGTLVVPDGKGGTWLYLPPKPQN